MSAYEASLAFLHGRLNYERQALPYGERTLRLTRMRQLLARLGHPERQFAVVHVAGTKGKGSTAAMMAAVLSAAGYRTGLFTSPHLERVEERVVVAGEMISAAEFASAVEQVQPAVEELDALSAASDDGHDSWSPTYFEVVTALALVHFAQRGRAGRRSRGRAGGPARFDQRLPARGYGHHQHQLRPHAAARPHAGR